MFVRCSVWDLGEKGQGPVDNWVITLRRCEKMLSELQVNDSLHNEGTNTVVMGKSG